MNIYNNLSLPAWSSNYEIGINSIDEQHKYLFELINSYYQMLSSNSFSPNELRELLEKLITYAKAHFSDEEMHMLKNNMDHAYFNIHVEQHEYFVNEVNNLSMFIDDDAAIVAPLIYEFVTQWLIEHIIKVDSLIKTNQ